MTKVWIRMHDAGREGKMFHTSEDHARMLIEDYGAERVEGYEPPVVERVWIKWHDVRSPRIQHVTREFADLWVDYSGMAEYCDPLGG